MRQSDPLHPVDFAPILAELGLEAEILQVVDPAPPPPSEGKPIPPLRNGSFLIGPIGAGLDIGAAARLFRRRGESALPADGVALFFLKDARPDRELARWREGLWPWLHLVAVYRMAGGAIERETLQRREALEGSSARTGVLLAARRRDFVLSPDATVEKFDLNAPGWNQEPGEPGHGHYRWMRRFVARLASPARGARILDFGCGAGWVGIEAALAAGGAELCAFDPSPEMVRLAGLNARRAGIERFQGRTGFGEDPPFPAGGEEPFDLVLSSGVVSFSPDQERWLDGLARAVRPGGSAVIADLNPLSHGMARRRRTRPLLPAREMNALAAAGARARLERRGFVHERTAGYQLTWPVPQAMHLSQTRAKGALDLPLLLLNRLAAGRASSERAFDSWAMRFRKG